MRRTAVGVLVCGGLLVSGCSSAPERELRQATAKVIDSANGENAVELRVAADRLIDVVEQQQADGRIDQERAARIHVLAGNVRSDADERIVAEVAGRRSAEPTTGSSDGESGASSDGGGADGGSADGGKTAADLAAERADARRAAADQAAAEQAEREQTEREQAAREQAEREQAERAAGKKAAGKKAAEKEAAEKAAEQQGGDQGDDDG